MAYLQNHIARATGHEQSDMLRFVFENATDDAMIATDSGGRVSLWSKGAERILGYREAEVLGEPIDLIYMEDDRKKGKPELERRVALKRGRVEELHWYRRKAGDSFWGQGIIEPLHDRAGQPRGFSILLRDKTAKRSTPEDLPYHLLAQAISDAIWDWDLVEGRIRWNNGIHTRFGYPPEAVDSDPSWWFNHIHPEDRENVHKKLMHYAEHGKDEWRDEYRFRTYDGRYVDVIDSARLLRDESGKTVRMIGAFLDITEQKRAEEQIKLIRRSSNIGFWHSDLSLGDLVGDEVAKEHFHLLPDEEVTPHILFERVHPEDRDATKETIQRSLAERSSFDIYYRTVHPDTGEIRWIHGLGGVAWSQNEEPMHFEGITLDVTEQKRLQHSLQEADRRKDDFLAVLSHELRNPLSAIRTAVHVAQGRRTAEHLPFALEVIEHQTKNMARLVDDLLDISTITSGKLELKIQRVDVIGAITRAADATHALFERKHHRLEHQHVHGPVIINADPTRLEQIIGNILTNAAKYTEPGGCIVVSAEREGSQAAIKIRDNGPGIAKEIIPHLFNLYAQGDRSRAPGEGGLGIGLSLVRQLVERQGGTVLVESELGKGSEFSIRFPLAEPLAEEDQLEGERRSSGKKVLVVDNNEHAARLVGRLLQSYGFQVRVCDEVTAAVQAADEFEPEAILLDIDSNAKSFEIAKMLRERVGRETLLIGASSYDDSEFKKQVDESKFDRLINKPIELESITEAVGGPGPGLPDSER